MVWRIHLRTDRICVRVVKMGQLNRQLCWHWNCYRMGRERSCLDLNTLELRKRKSILVFIKILNSKKWSQTKYVPLSDRDKFGGVPWVPLLFGEKICVFDENCTTNSSLCSLFLRTSCSALSTFDFSWNTEKSDEAFCSDIKLVENPSRSDKSFSTFFGGFFKSWKKYFLSMYGRILPVPSGSKSENASM